MDLTTYVLIGAVLVLVIVVAVATRRRRDRSLEPVRLGPTWVPPGGNDGSRGPRPAIEILGDDPRVASVASHTGHDEATVATVVLAHDEFLAVLGVAPLPSGHQFRVYDAYDPPVVGRDATNQPITDPVRVARDIERHTGVTQDTARQVLEALLDVGASHTRGA